VRACLASRCGGKGRPPVAIRPLVVFHLCGAPKHHYPQACCSQTLHAPLAATTLITHTHPVHAHEAVHLAQVHHLQLAGVPQVIVRLALLQLVPEGWGVRGGAAWERGGEQQGCAGVRGSAVHPCAQRVRSSRLARRDPTTHPLILAASTTLTPLHTQ